MSAFSESLNEDLDGVFFDVEAFGDVVVLVRGGTRVSIHGLYDTQAVQEDLSTEVAPISHRHRLCVRKADLPGQVARKGDVFELDEKNGFHKTLRLRAADFADESDGTVTYQLELVKKVPTDGQ